MLPQQSREERERGWRGLIDLVHKSAWISRFAKLHLDGQLSLRTAKLSIIDFLRSETESPVIYERHIVDALRQNLDRPDAGHLDSLIRTLYEQHTEQIQTKCDRASWRVEAIKIYLPKEPVALTLPAPAKEPTL